ncbi:MAG TPA: Hsp33 family molecular chaperone HslO [Blastocatellia bacterium]|nr:Hsp33 family molecular chaperone HslO [Blastocatellia bacterium]
MKYEMDYREDHLIQATAEDATIRLIAALTTNLVAEACDRHRTAPTASAALGRTLTGALLLGSAYKDLEYITLRFDCDGPVGGIVAEASARGTVRGYVRNPAAHLPPNAIGKLDVKGIVGEGMLHVIREAGFEIGLMKEPYYGSTPIVSGEIAEDIAHYLAISEQINSAVSLGVFVESEQERVTAAGGYMIQALPGAEESALAAIERSMSAAPSVTDAIRGGADAAEMLRLALGNIRFNTLETRPVEFLCKCSYERVVSIVTALGREEIEDMLEKDKGAELTCHFCNSVYYLDENALRGILEPPPPIVM